MLPKCAASNRVHSHPIQPGLLAAASAYASLTADEQPLVLIDAAPKRLLFSPKPGSCGVLLTNHRLHDNVPWKIPEPNHVGAISLEDVTTVDVADTVFGTNRVLVNGIPLLGQSPDPAWCEPVFANWMASQIRSLRQDSMTDVSLAQSIRPFRNLVAVESLSGKPQTHWGDSIPSTLLNHARQSYAAPDSDAERSLFLHDDGEDGSQGMLVTTSAVYSHWPNHRRMKWDLSHINKVELLDSRGRFHHNVFVTINDARLYGWPYMGAPGSMSWREPAFAMASMIALLATVSQGHSRRVQVGSHWIATPENVLSAEAAVGI